MNEKIRVLVVEDSVLMRRKITAMINESPDCEVIATARDGFEAIKIVSTLKPDVITMDYLLPRMDGLTCLGYIMSEWPTPVVMLSGYAQEGTDIAIQALEFGAVDFVVKPGGTVSLHMDQIKEELLQKIRIAARVNVTRLQLLYLRKVKQVSRRPLLSLEKVVAIGTSTGGPRALAQIVPKLPPDLPAAVLIVQHMPEGFTKPFAERLNGESRIEVKEAEEGEAIEAGKVLIAPGGFQMCAKNLGKNRGAAITLHKEEKKRGLAPSADVTMRSVAPLFGQNTVGVILTGMGEDGTEGLRFIKEYGGKTLAEHESTCVIYGMPDSAVKAGVVDEVVPLDKMAERIVRAVR